jgi:hypothetical protein
MLALHHHSPQIKACCSPAPLRPLAPGVRARRHGVFLPAARRPDRRTAVTMISAPPAATPARNTAAAPAMCGTTSHSTSPPTAIVPPGAGAGAGADLVVTGGRRLERRDGLLGPAGLTGHVIPQVTLVGAGHHRITCRAGHLDTELARRRTGARAFEIQDAGGCLGHVEGRGARHGHPLEPVHLVRQAKKGEHHPGHGADARGCHQPARRPSSPAVTLPGAGQRGGQAGKPARSLT